MISYRKQWVCLPWITQCCICNRISAAQTYCLFCHKSTVHAGPHIMHVHTASFRGQSTLVDSAFHFCLGVAKAAETSSQAWRLVGIVKSIPVPIHYQWVHNGRVIEWHFWSNSKSAYVASFHTLKYCVGFEPRSHSLQMMYQTIKKGAEICLHF